MERITLLVVRFVAGMCTHNIKVYPDDTYPPSIKLRHIRVDYQPMLH
jgi:hypothetical protein